MLPQSVLVTTLVIAVVELIRRVGEKDWKGVATIVCTAIVGALAGFFGLDSLTVESGLIAGLAAAGIVRVAQAVSGK